jgi:type IV pilus assembly protein PilB
VSAQGILDILVTNGKLTAAQADAVRLEAAQRATTHEDVLISRQFVSETDLLRTKAETLNIPFVQLDETGVSPEALTVIPESVARRYQMLPFTIDKAERTIAVAMKNPLDLGAIDFVEKKNRLQTHAALRHSIPN